MANKVQIIVDAQDRASKELKGVNKELKGMGAEGKKSSDRMAMLGKALAGVATLGTITAIGKAVIELGKLGAKAEQSETALRNLSGGAQAAEGYIRAIQTASRGTVSELDAMQMATTGITLGVVANADQMERLTEIAVTLGKAQGLTATQAVGDLTAALGRQEPEILDNLGITLRLSEAYDGYAESLGKSASQLTDAEKKQAFINQALEKGADVAEQLGGVIEDNQTKVEAGTAAWRDLRVEIGRHYAKSVGEAAGETGGLVTRMKDFIKYSRESGESLLNFGNQFDYFNYVVFGSSTALENWNSIQAHTATELERFANMTGHAGSETEELNHALKNTQGVTVWREEMGILAAKTRTAGEATQPLKKGLEGINKATSGLDDAIAPLERLGDLQFDNESLWQLALASGASADALGELAVNLGIATKEEVLLAQKQQELIEEFGKTGNVDAYTEGMARLYAQSAEVRGVIQGVIDRLNAMPDEKVIRIRTEMAGGGAGLGVGADPGGGLPEYQHGGEIPGTGPQLAIVHGGEYVIPPGGAPVQSGASGGSAHGDVHLHVNNLTINDERHLDMLAGKLARRIQRGGGGSHGHRVS